MGLGLFALDVGDPDEVVFPKNALIIEYAGEIIREFEREERYGDGTAPYALGGLIENEDDEFDTPLIDCAFYRSIASLSNHKPEGEANCHYIFDEDTDIHWIAAKRDIKSGRNSSVTMEPNTLSTDPKLANTPLNPRVEHHLSGIADIF